MKPEEIHSYRFKSFTLKPLERQLFDHDRSISLTPKAFDVLTHLIARAGHLVTKEELLETIWADSFVEEASLARLVHTIRKTLGEDENSDKFIETVPTKGYRFVAEVEEVNRDDDAAEKVWSDRVKFTDTAQKKAASRWVFAVTAILIAVGLVAAFTVWRNKTGSTATIENLPSIAVLPFRPTRAGERDLDSDLAFAYALMSNLTQSKKLRVRPFSTMRAYTDLTMDAIEIGKDPKVETDYVLDSTYFADRGRLHVTSTLYNVKTGLVEDSFSYDGDDTDLYAAGKGVAADIVPKVLAKLNLPAVLQRNRGTENEEAWRSYLQGMILVNRRSVDGAEKGLEEFDKAIRLDPNYAEAYMGRAHALQTILTNGGSREKYCSPAREAEQRALELDPTSGDTWAMLATNHHGLCTWDIAEAESAFQKAVELSPNSGHVHRFYAVNIAGEKRFDEALYHLTIARELDPHDTFNERLWGRVLFQARRWDEAIEQGIKVKEMDPEAEQTSFVYMSYEMKEEYDKAFEWFLVVKSLDGENETDLNAWRATYAESGWPGVLRRRLQRALDEEKTTDSLNKRARLLEEITTLSVQLGEDDQAFVYMNKAVDTYVLFGGQILVNPYFDRIRSDPRYTAILARTWNSHGGNYK